MDSSCRKPLETSSLFTYSKPLLGGRKTKIICAIGPACWSKENLLALLDEGMNVARLNFSHGSHELHAATLSRLREALLERPGVHCSVLMDTKGPEIRTGLLKSEYVDLKKNEELLFVTDYTVLGDEKRIAITYQELPRSVQPGSTILVADGVISFKVLECGDDWVRVCALNSGRIGERKNVKLPGVSVQLPGVTEKDEYDILNFGLVHDVDIISCSFVRTASNIRHVRDVLERGGARADRIKVHAKIENLEGLSNIDEILEEADGVHVSRGDLGMELPPEKLFLAQKHICSKANVFGIPVVVSTQMLNSMIYNPRPTHAECTDVANAVLDGADAVMLSGETASGIDPPRAVHTMSLICCEAERAVAYRALFLSLTKAGEERRRQLLLDEEEGEGDGDDASATGSQASVLGGGGGGGGGG